MTECAICFCGIFERRFCVFDCGHLFHQDCTELLSETSRNCPVCRQEVLRIIRPYFDYENDFPVTGGNSHAPANRELNSSLQHLQLELQKCRKSCEEMAGKVEQLTLVLAYEQNRYLEAYRTHRQLEETLLLKEREHHLIVNKLRTDLEAYKASSFKKIDQLSAECESLRRFGTANDVCELVQSSLLTHSTEEYLQMKQHATKESLLQDMTVWIAKCQDLQQQNNQLQTKNGRLLIELEKQKRAERDKAVLTKPTHYALIAVANEENGQPEFTGKRAANDENLADNGTEKRIKIKEKNLFFGRPTPNNPKFSDFTGKKSDGRGNFVKIARFASGY